MGCAMSDFVTHHAICFPLVLSGLSLALLDLETFVDTLYKCNF